jgi:hypothetical protein
MAGETRVAAEKREEMLSILTQFPKEGLPAPEAVNLTRIDHVGSEVQLTVGYVDLGTLVELVNQAKQGALREAAVKVDVAHRFVFSLEAFTRLKAQVDQIAANVAANEAAGGTAPTVR